MNNVDMIGVLLVHPIERSTVEGYFQNTNPACSVKFHSICSILVRKISISILVLNPYKRESLSLLTGNLRAH